MRILVSSLAVRANNNTLESLISVIDRNLLNHPPILKAYVNAQKYLGIKGIHCLAGAKLAGLTTSEYFYTHETVSKVYTKGRLQDVYTKATGS